MKVLFVQEQPFLATALKLTLLTKGYDLIFSDDINHPHAVIENINPCIVIADISKGAGINYVQEAKKKNVPIIVLSENGKEDVLQYAFDNGADDYLSFPISLSELALRVSIVSAQKLGNNKVSTSFTNGFGSVQFQS